MSANRLLVMIGVIGLMFIGGFALADHWGKIEADNNAFAKDCNNRGGIAIFSMEARQCYGAAAKGAGDA